MILDLDGHWSLRRTGSGRCGLLYRALCIPARLSGQIESKSG